MCLMHIHCRVLARGGHAFSPCTAARSIQCIVQNAIQQPTCMNLASRWRLLRLIGPGGSTVSSDTTVPGCSCG